MQNRIRILLLLILIQHATQVEHDIKKHLNKLVYEKTDRTCSVAELRGVGCLIYFDYDTNVSGDSCRLLPPIDASSQAIESIQLEVQDCY